MALTNMSGNREANVWIPGYADGWLLGHDEFIVF